MSEQKELSLYQQQKKIKPLIEDIIPNFLDVDMQKNALDLIVYMREKKLTPKWTLYNAWKSLCRSKAICFIRICDAEHYKRRPNPPTWSVTPYINNLDKYEDVIIKEKLQNIVWDNTSRCVSCRQCAPGKTVTILGKEVKGVCCNVPLMCVFDPDETEINAMKRLLELEQNARIEQSKK